MFGLALFLGAEMTTSHAVSLAYINVILALKKRAKALKNAPKT